MDGSNADFKAIDVTGGDVQWVARWGLLCNEG